MPKKRSSRRSRRHGNASSRHVYVTLNPLVVHVMRDKPGYLTEEPETLCGMSVYGSHDPEFFDNRPRGVDLCKRCAAAMRK